jgi:tetratricopeptide (TPR) repeat protein
MIIIYLMVFKQLKIGIGFCYHLMGNFEKAIDYFHKSLSFNDENITNELLLKSIKCISKKY